MTEVIFRKIDLPYYKEKGFKGWDMHFHTEYSMDGMSRIPSVLKKAKKLGIGVAITDHNQIKGNILASKNKLGVTIIPGIEVTSIEGVHTLYYFYTTDELKEFYKKEVQSKMKKTHFYARITAEELMIRSDKYNCIIDCPHPFVPGFTGMGRIPITKEMKKRIKIIEVLNGYNLRHLNKKAIQWAAQTNKPMSAGSDGHTTTELAQVLTLAKADNVEKFFKEVMKKKNILRGTEENLFKKAIYSIEKEETYLKKLKKNKEEIKLLKYEFGEEFNYIKIKKRGTRHYCTFQASSLVKFKNNQE